MTYLLLLSVLLNTLLLAQTKEFSLIIHKPFDAKLFDVTQDYDRSLTAVGFVQEYAQTNSSSKTYTNAFDYLADSNAKQGTLMRLLKVNQKAKILMNKNLTIHNFAKAIALVKTPSNGYFVGGYTMDGSLLILKLDASAQIIFSKKFGTKNYDSMHRLILLRDGGVLAIGSSLTSRDTADNMFQTGLGKNDIFLTRFSQNGQKLWSKKYGTEYDDIGIDAVEANDGSIVVLNATHYDKHTDVTLLRIDENGNKRWLKHYEGDKLITPHKIIKLHDNNFVIALSQYDDTRKEQVRLIKFDLYKNIIYDQIIFTSYASVLNDIKEFSNGILMGVGYVKDAYNTDALVMLFDAHLSLLKQEHYGSDNYDAFHALSILHNSQVAVAGVHTDASSQESNMWLVKLNQDATMAQIALDTQSVYEVLTQIFKEEIEKKELFIGEDLSINLTAKRLYFQAGISELNKAQKNFLKTFAKKLLPFLQNNQSIIENLEVNGHTSREWKGADFRTNYLKNAKLSMARAYSALHCLLTSVDKKSQILLTQLLKGSGNSYAQNSFQDSNEDAKKSRRVSFKIILKETTLSKF